MQIFSVTRGERHLRNHKYAIIYAKIKTKKRKCDSGVTVIMAASQAVDPGSTPGCRTNFFLLLSFWLLLRFVRGQYQFERSRNITLIFLISTDDIRKEFKPILRLKWPVLLVLFGCGNLRAGITLSCYWADPSYAVCWPIWTILSGVRLMMVSRQRSNRATRRFQKTVGLCRCNPKSCKLAQNRLGRPRNSRRGTKQYKVHYFHFWE